MGGVVATHLLNDKNIQSLFLLSPAGNFNEILKRMITQSGKKTYRWCRNQWISYFK